MSLVNLAHVCSHLQNASLARLGLTSIPYTKLHLSLSLLLLKQGFISSVKLGGASPPASCFGNGPKDNHYVSNHPHDSAGRDPHSPEAALALMVREGRNAEWLQANGFKSEAVEFAQEHAVHNMEELSRQGWQEEVIRFITSLRSEIDVVVAERDAASTLDSTSTTESTQTQQEYARLSPEQRRKTVEAELLSELPIAHQALYMQYRTTSTSHLLTTSFTRSDLAALAGPQGLRSETDLQRNGITIEAMGLSIPNQPITLPQKLYQDPAHLEDEGVVTQQNRASRRLWLGLKYYQSAPVLSKAALVSKPTKRIWLSHSELANVVRGKRAGEVRPLTRIGEILAVSTDRGIMEARECVERRIGGMALCRVW